MLYLIQYLSSIYVFETIFPLEFLGSLTGHML